MISRAISHKLMALAEKYETPDFIDDDPSRFMWRYHSEEDREVAAFISASLALGRRPAILAKLEYIFGLAGSSPSRWLLNRGYEEYFSEDETKFYRFFSNSDMLHFFHALRHLLAEHGSIGGYFRVQYEQRGIEPLDAITTYFSQWHVGTLIPKNTKSLCKRLNMLLRWLVRTGSPVDMGLWSWFPASRLIIPVDTHVAHQALRMGIVSKTGSTMKTALEITEAMREIWPDDPCRGDFALFGTGVNAL